MDINTFANYLLSVFLVLQFVGMLIFLLLFYYVGSKSIPFAIILVFAIDTVALYLLHKVKVYDHNGKRVSDFGKVIGDFLAVMVWTGVASVIFTIIGVVFSLKVINRNKIIAVFLPFIATATFYIAFAFDSATK